MAGISPKLPLNKSAEDGKWALTKTVTEAVKQNFKNLILTLPGERIMIPHFGVGLPQFLFELKNSFVSDDIKAKIIEQTKLYMPSVTLQDIQIEEGSEFGSVNNRNSISVTIFYRIEPLNFNDVLNIKIE